MKPRDTLPKPDCEYGYTDTQLDDILGDRRPEFNRWMRGQTVAVCDGRRWIPETRVYVASGCGPHGAATYGSDLRRFLAGGPVLD